MMGWVAVLVVMGSVLKALEATAERGGSRPVWGFLWGTLSIGCFIQAGIVWAPLL